MTVRRRRNLLVVRAGDGSLHPGWLEGPGRREFDLLVSYYGDRAGQGREGADLYHAMAGPRWPAHDAICRADPALLAAYDHVGFACDDLSADLPTWNRLFATCRAHALDLAQPAVTGPVSHPITSPVPGCLLRLTNFVEIMCPVFSRRALAALAPTFGDSRSGWGLDVLWQSRLAGPGWRMAIVDSVSVRHVRPLREGTLYPVLAAMGVRPHDELAAILARPDVPPFTARELARIPLPEPADPWPAQWGHRGRQAWRMARPSAWLGRM